MSTRNGTLLLTLIAAALAACEPLPTYSGEGQHCTSKYSTEAPGTFLCNPAANRGIFCVTTRNQSATRDGAAVSLPSYVCRKKCDPAITTPQCQFPSDVCCAGRDLEESSTPLYVCVPPEQCDLQPIPTLRPDDALPSADELMNESREQ